MCKNIDEGFINYNSRLVVDLGSWINNYLLQLLVMLILLVGCHGDLLSHYNSQVKFKSWYCNDSNLLPNWRYPYEKIQDNFQGMNKTDFANSITYFSQIAYLATSSPRSGSATLWTTECIRLVWTRS